MSNGEPVFCLIDGPHYHACGERFGDYQVVEGVAFYMGELSLVYIEQRAKRWKQVNDEMLPFARLRPVVNFEPPRGWQGTAWIPPWVKFRHPHREPQRERRVRIEVR
jgi:hypothetical protein